MLMVFKLMPAWRNGRRDRLKIYCQQWREGSSPLAGTIIDFSPLF